MPEWVSQSEAANRLGVTPATFSNWKNSNGNRPPWWVHDLMAVGTRELSNKRSEYDIEWILELVNEYGTRGRGRPAHRELSEADKLIDEEFGDEVLHHKDVYAAAALREKAKELRKKNKLQDQELIAVDDMNQFLKVIGQQFRSMSDHISREHPEALPIVEETVDRIAESIKEFV